MSTIKEKNCKTLILLDDMIADMLNNKSFNLKVKISAVFITILFCCSKKCQIKFYTLFYHESYKQMRA